MEDHYALPENFDWRELSLEEARFISSQTDIALESVINGKTSVRNWAMLVVGILVPILTSMSAFAISVGPSHEWFVPALIAIICFSYAFWNSAKVAWVHKTLGVGCPLTELVALEPIDPSNRDLTLIQRHIAMAIGSQSALHTEQQNIEDLVSRLRLSLIFVVLSPCLALASVPIQIFVRLVL